MNHSRKTFVTACSVIPSKKPYSPIIPKRFRELKIQVVMLPPECYKAKPTELFQALIEEKHKLLVDEPRISSSSIPRSNTAAFFVQRANYKLPSLKQLQDRSSGKNSLKKVHV